MVNGFGFGGQNAVAVFRRYYPGSERPGVIGVAQVRRPGARSGWPPTRDAVVALEVLSSDEAFGAGCLKRLGDWPEPAATPAAVRSGAWPRRAEAVEALLAGTRGQRPACRSS